MDFEAHRNSSLSEYPTRKPKSVLTSLGIKSDKADVHFFDSLGRAIVEVPDDVTALPSREQIHLAQIDTGWDLEIQTQSSLENKRQTAKKHFGSSALIAERLAEQLVRNGYIGLSDVSVIEPEFLAHLGDITISEANTIIERVDQLCDVRDEEAR